MGKLTEHGKAFVRWLWQRYREERVWPTRVEALHWLDDAGLNLKDMERDVQSLSIERPKFDEPERVAVGLKALIHLAEVKELLKPFPQLVRHANQARIRDIGRDPALLQETLRAVAEDRERDAAQFEQERRMLQTEHQIVPRGGEEAGRGAGAGRVRADTDGAGGRARRAGRADRSAPWGDPARAGRPRGGGGS